MTQIFGIYLNLWKSSPDALRVSTRVGSIYFYLFEDLHMVFRERLVNVLASIEASGIFMNRSADYTGRILARTAIPVMEVYSHEPDFERLFHQSMHGLLLNPEVATGAQF